MCSRDCLAVHQSVLYAESCTDGQQSRRLSCRRERKHLLFLPLTERQATRTPCRSALLPHTIMGQSRWLRSPHLPPLMLRENWRPRTPRLPQKMWWESLSLLLPPAIHLECRWTRHPRLHSTTREKKRRLRPTCLPLLMCGDKRRLRPP